MPPRSSPKRRRPPQSTDAARGGGMFEQMLAVVRAIPRGHVATYGQVARAAGFPGAARQVTWALRSAAELPWHRVVGSGGRILLGGEAGAEQARRLRKEGVRVIDGRVAMDRHQVPLLLGER